MTAGTGTNLHRHVSDALELVVDDQLRDELDKSSHVDGLSRRRDDERIPAPMGLVQERVHGIRQEERTGAVGDESEGQCIVLLRLLLVVS